MKTLLIASAVYASTVFAQDTGKCAANPPLGDISAKPSWNGWGNGPANARYQGPGAQLDPAQVPNLKLKWAFGFPGAKSVSGQPSVVGGRVFVGSESTVYSIDAEKGCLYWSFIAPAPVRSAVSVGPSKAGNEYLAFFGDQKGAAYAVNAQTGQLVWKTQVESHPAARITGAPSLYFDKLYIPVASAEEPLAVDPAYQCCTFRGSVVALDAYTGKQVWKTYTIADVPKANGKNAKGTPRFTPSGGGVWNSPTLDPKRRAIYIGTGDAYTQPAAKTTDSIMALDMDTGRILWSVQDTQNDAWVVSCIEGRGTKENCPENAGPDFDFGSSPMLRTLADGRTVVIAGQKSGVVWAHDVDHKGAVVWKTSVVTKAPGPQGQISFGGSADDRMTYFGLNSGGVVALLLSNGERKWFTPMDPAQGRSGGQDAAVSVIPGVLFSGGWDGVLRALSTTDGKVVWQFDMLRNFDTVNKVTAKGGSLGSAGPTIAGGTVFVGSGYPGVQNGREGNVLLAFRP
jgi:polyvinyl alcohol dehydrogenase (cytochrome)